MSMLSQIQALTRITNYQFFRGKVRLVLLLWVGLLPSLVKLLSRLLASNQGSHIPISPIDEYFELFVGLFVGLILPASALYAGILVLSEELESRTLVHLWTRPVSRTLLWGTKSLVAFGWLSLFLVITLLATYVVCGLMENPQMLAKEAGIISWHVLAALLGAFPYFYLGMFLSLFTRKPLTYGGGFLFFVEFVVMIIPSSLKLLSPRFCVLILSGCPQSLMTDGPLELIMKDAEVTDFSAASSLLIFGALMATLSWFLFTQREHALREGVEQQ
ncbi:MAG: ABC transporter permease [Candidatus Sumerlaea chitinivorans]|jgi:ABC-2 type transport system permease protein|nr:ABC transporter permease [Candidatus Sumerlaea chitinivorans]